MNNKRKKISLLKTTALLLALSFSTQVLAGTPEMSATTPGQDCVKKGVAVGAVALGLVALDCLFTMCAFTIAAAATLPVEIAATTAIVGTPIVAGATACAEGAVENVIVNSQTD